MHPMKKALTAALLAAATLSADQLTIGTSSNQLNLTLSGAESKVGVKLYDLMGRELFNQQEMTLSSGMQSVPLNSSLARGMYIMQVSVDGKQFSKKMIAGSSATFEVSSNSLAPNIIHSRAIASGNNIIGYSMVDITGGYSNLSGLGRSISIGDLNGDGNEDLFAINFGILKMGSSGSVISDSTMPFGAAYNTGFADYYNSLNYSDYEKSYAYSGKIVDAAYLGKHIAGGVTSDVVVIAVEKTRKPISGGGLTSVTTNDLIILKLSKNGVINEYNYLYTGNYSNRNVGNNKITMLSALGDLDKNGYIDFAAVDNSDLRTIYPTGTSYPPIDFAAYGRVTLYFMESASVVHKTVELTAESKNISSVKGYGNTSPLYLNRRCTNVNDLNGDNIADLMIGQVVFYGDKVGAYTGGYKDMSAPLANIFQRELTAKSSFATNLSERVDVNGDGYIEFVGDTVGRSPGTAFRQKVYTLIPGKRAGGIIEPILFPMPDFSSANKTYPDVVFSYPINSVIKQTAKYGSA